MSRWFRFYDDAVNDPKVQRLAPDLFKAWINILCIISKSGGALPATAEVAFVLRVKPTKAAEYMTALKIAGLLDVRDDGAFVAHNWDSRQFKSDVTDPTAPSRQKAYRERNKNRNGDRNGAVTNTHTRTETEAETEQIKKDSAADAAAADPPPIDHRKRLFDEGLKKLAAMTGKGPDACRSFVGKCLKAADDNAITVLGLIEDAERNQTVDPTAWIAARLKPREFSNGKTTQPNSLIGAIDRQLAILESAESTDFALSESPVLRLSR